MKIKKNIQFIYQKNVGRKNVDLLIIEGKEKGHYVFIKDFNTFMHNKILQGWKKFFVVIVYKPLVQKKY